MNGARYTTRGGVLLWSWIPVPRRLLSDDRLLNLELADRAVLLSLYLCADEHGRFDAGEMALRRNTGVVTGESLRPVVERLSRLRLVHLYERNDQRFGVIDHFDEDITADHTKKRPRPSHPAPPRDVWASAGCSGVYRGGSDEPCPSSDRSPTDQRPDAGRLHTETTEREDILREGAHARGRTSSDRSPTDQRPDAGRLQTESTEREDIIREGAHARGRTSSDRSPTDHFETLPEGCRNAALAWCVEVAKVRRRHGGALWAECTAAQVAPEFAHRLGQISEVGDEAFVRAVETMIERGKGFGRGMPGEGVAYLDKIARNWTAERDNEKTVEKKGRRRRMVKGDGFRRLGPAPEQGEIDRTVDDSLSDVMEG